MVGKRGAVSGPPLGHVAFPSGHGSHQQGGQSVQGHHAVGGQTHAVPNACRKWCSLAGRRVHVRHGVSDICLFDATAKDREPVAPISVSLMLLGVMHALQRALMQLL